MQKLRLPMLILICMLTLSGCQCSHAWDAATCDTPKTCQFCGAAEGAPLGHVWNPATCEEPMSCQICHQADGKPLPHKWVNPTCTTAKTCALCGSTDGEPLGHVWQDASCEAPRHCAVCTVEDGNALGHTWIDATAEAPKTCTACGKTEGTPIVNNSRFDPNACKSLFGKWESRRSRTAENIGLTDNSFTFIELTVYTFRNDGTVTISTEVEDLDACKQAMSDAIIDGLCAKYGSKEKADQALLSLASITAVDYAAVYARTYFGNIESITTEGVYFVSGDDLFMSDTWNTEMFRYRFILTDNRLTLIDRDNEQIELVQKYSRRILPCPIHCPAAVLDHRPLQPLP